MFSPSNIDIEKLLSKQVFFNPSLINKESLTDEDFLSLLSATSFEDFSQLAKKAKEFTNQFFGKTIQLYIPLYLSNECCNGCLYCGFNQQQKVNRKTLNLEEAILNLKAIRAKGFDNILLLTGEHPQNAGIDYLVTIIKEAQKMFSYVGLEIFPTDQDGYKSLSLAGADGLTIYQETYHQITYNKMHPFGPKKDYKKRLLTPEEAINGNFKKIGLGALLGLYTWKYEALALFQHLTYLQKKFWSTDFSLSFPRIHDAPKNFQASMVSDQDFVKLILCFRVAFPNVGIVLSTRETPEIRNNLLGLGVTQISAESKTNPGGYLDNNFSEQFKINDERSLQEILFTLNKKGFDPVFKDWSFIF